MDRRLLDRRDHETSPNAPGRRADRIFQGNASPTAPRTRTHRQSRLLERLLYSSNFTAHHLLAPAVVLALPPVQILMFTCNWLTGYEW